MDSIEQHEKPATMGAIADACATAWTHIATRPLADATPEEIRACMHHAAVQACERRLQTQALAGDLAGCKVLLQELNGIYRWVLADLRKGTGHANPQ